MNMRLRQALSDGNVSRTTHRDPLATDEDALLASERRFRAAFQDAPIGMVLTALDGTPVQVNRAICTLLGFTEDELLSTTLRARTHPEDVAANQELLDRMLAGEHDTFSLEKRYIRKDGLIVWALLSVSLVRDDAGTPLYFLSHVQDISDRKSAETRLKASQQLASDILERITDGFCALDRQWRFTAINTAAEQNMGRPREALIGKNLWQEFPHLAKSPVFELYHRALAADLNLDFDRLSPRDNNWYNIRAYPSPNGLSIFFRNITESRQLTYDLRASEEKYRTLVEQLPAAVYLQTHDEDEVVVYYSPYIYDLTGYTLEEAMSTLGDKHWLRALHPDDRVRIAEEDARGTVRGEPFGLEYRVIRKDGGIVWVRDECMPIRDDSGEIVAWQGVMLDITDRINAEEAQARLAAIVEGAEDAIISRALDGTITSWNHGAEQLYGYRAAEAIGQPTSMLFPDGNLVPLAFDTMEFGEQPTRFEAMRLRKDGRPIEVAISLSPIRDRNGVLTGVSSITRDISERIRREAELRAALEAAEAGVRAKSLFLAMMSHELRTPLQAVLGYADFLLHGPPGSLTAEQAEDVGYIRQGAGRMVALIEQMLDLSRMEAGRLEMASEPVDLATVLEQVRQDIAPQAAAKRLEFTIIVAPRLPKVLGDALRLRQIVLNLVGNAVKFTDAGLVCIEARPSKGGVDVIVTDTGIGIAAQDLSHIFEEFRQVDSGPTRRYGGAGLGLAISKRLAEQMGGSISVESQPEHGSVFTLHLLAAKSVRARKRESRQPSSS